MNDRPRIEWMDVHEIKGDDGTIVRVQRRGDIRPSYSYQIGRERKQIDGEPPNNRLLPFVNVRVEAMGAVVVNRTSLDLVKQALDWIEKDAAVYEANFIDKKIAREERGMRNGDDYRHTEKTERKRARGRG